MSDTFQREIPRARINIALELETEGAASKNELPLKTLVIGDYSYGQGQGEISERPRIAVNKHNIEQVLAELQPRARFVVEDQMLGQGNIGVDLTFSHFGDFAPDAVAAQIPQLNRLMAMRNLLRDLKSNLLDNVALRKELERLLQDRTQLTALKRELSELVDNQLPASLPPASE